MTSIHIPVMLSEVLDLIKPQAGKTYIDTTLGGGGHTKVLLEASAPTGRVFALDWDAGAIESAEAQLGRTYSRLTLIEGNFADIGELVGESADGILFDLGVSSDQLADMERGFSFTSDSLPDMCMSLKGRPAYQLLQKGGEEEIADVLYEYGGERLSRRIARAIVSAAKRGEELSAKRLASLVAKCYRPGRHRIHPATRTFLALRIWANDELTNLKAGLEGACGLLNLRGRLLVISYHSLEDGLVKRYFRGLAGKEGGGRFELLTKKPLKPTPDEVRENPRARSARLRVIERVA